MKMLCWQALFFWSLASTTYAQSFSPGCELPFKSIQESHEIDESCSIDGTKRDGGELSSVKLAENEAKNDFCNTNSPLPMLFSTFTKLQSAADDIAESSLDNRQAALSNLVTVNGKKYGEGKVVEYVAFIIHAKPSNVKRSKTATKFGESVNCYRQSEEENDIHIVLGRTLDDEPCDTVTAEISPHFRPLAWTPDNLNHLEHHPVRMTGQLFFDSSHKPCKDGKGSPARASVWEIHPVYAVEVCRKTSIQTCKSGPRSNWVPLDEWFGEDENPE